MSWKYIAKQVEKGQNHLLLAGKGSEEKLTQYRHQVYETNWICSGACWCVRVSPCDSPWVSPHAQACPQFDTWEHHAHWSVTHMSFQDATVCVCFTLFLSLSLAVVDVYLYCVVWQ